MASRPNDDESTDVEKSAGIRWVETARQSIEQAELINEITAALNQPIEVPDILQTAVDRLANALDVAYAGVALLNEAGSLLRFVADHAASGHTSLVGLEFDVSGSSLPMEEVAKRQLIRITDLLGIPHEGVAYQFPIQRQLATLVAVPLVLHGQAIGVLGCAGVGDRLAIGSQDIRLMETIANLSAVRVEQARLLEAARQRAAELASLYLASMEITRQQGIIGLFRTILERSVALLKADGGKLFLCEPKKQEVECVMNLQFPAPEASEKMAYGEGIVGRAVLSGKASLLNDEAAWGEDHANDHAAWKPQSLLSVPMLWQDQAEGVIQVFRQAGKASFRSTDQELLSLFASQAASALENARLYERLQRQAITDELTGVYNRRGLFELGRREVERSRRYHHNLSAILFDIDHFKQVNDHYGHAVGDQVLAALGKICYSSVREVDIVGRYGGEEFVVLLPEVDLIVAKQVAERLRSVIGQIIVALDEQEELRLTVSLGVASLAENDSDLDALLNRADDAMYAAKNAGRNRVIVM